jgi:hypothetical protein
MIEVKLSLEDWQKVLAVLAQAQWQVVNGLIMHIGEQLRAQATRPNGPDQDARPEPIRQ